jgi:hypothetical protein
MKEKIVYEETYAKNSLRIKPDLLGIKHLEETGFKVTEGFINKSGLVDRNGKKVYFQDIRVYMLEDENN